MNNLSIRLGMVPAKRASMSRSFLTTVQIVHLGGLPSPAVDSLGRCEVEEQVLGEVDGDPAARDGERHAAQVRC